MNAVLPERLAHVFPRSARSYSVAMGVLLVLASGAGIADALIGTSLLRDWKLSGLPQLASGLGLFLIGCALALGGRGREWGLQPWLGGAVLAYGALLSIGTLVDGGPAGPLHLLEGILPRGAPADLASMSMATPISFMLMGAAHVVAHGLARSRRRIVLRLLLAATAGIGLAGLLASHLEFQDLFASGALNGLPTLSSLGLLTAAASGWLAWRDEDWNRPLWIRSEGERIVFNFGLIFIAALAVASVSGIAALKQGIEATLSREMAFALQSRRDMVATVIERDIRQTVGLAQDPDLIRRLAGPAGKASHPGDGGAMREVLERILKAGSDAVELLGPDGSPIAVAGTFARSSLLKLDLAHVQPTTLMWDGELLMQTEAVVADGKRRLATIRAQYRLPELRGMLFEAEALGRTSELELCGTRGRLLHCAPSRFNTSPHDTERVIGGRQLPMSIALGGAHGVIKTIDQRGQRVLAAYALMPRVSLGIVLKTDLAELYAPLYTQIAYLLGFTIVLVAAGAALLLWYVRPMAGRLTASEHRLQLAVEGSRLALWEWDCHTQTVLLGGTWAEIVAGTAGPAKRTVAALVGAVHPEDATALRRHATRFLKGTLRRFDLVYRVRSGANGWAWIQTVGEVVERDAQGRAAKAVGTSRDVTQQKQGEEMLRLARDEAERNSRETEAFLATVSHEIRTPLNGLLGLLELLALTRLDAGQLQQLEVARDSGRAMARIIDDLLDFAKIEAGRLEFVPEPTALARILAAVADTYRAVASSKNVRIAQQVDPRISPYLLLDPLRLTQVLGNLASNAVKFTSAGYVELRAEFVGREGGTETVSLQVRDTGIGMSDAEQALLFRRFQQAEGGRSRRYGGSGLGLAISRRLVELMHGEIGVRSVPGEGSTFSVRIAFQVCAAPQALPGPALPVASAPGEAPSPDNPSVLVVDDHPVNRMLLAQQLQQLGVPATTVEDGNQALAAWRSGDYAVLIADCNMPGLDGYELTREIRRIERQESRARTPILGWTASVMKDAIDQCLSAGMDDVLRKPSSLEGLQTAITRISPRKFRFAPTGS